MCKRKCPRFVLSSGRHDHTLRLRQAIKKCPCACQTDQLAHWFCVCSYTFCHYIGFFGSSRNIFLPVAAFCCFPTTLKKERWQLFCPCLLNWRENPYPKLLLEQGSGCFDLEHKSFKSYKNQIKRTNKWLMPIVAASDT